MTLPPCPSCREKMSATEFGHYGAFECFYCQGTWLPPSAIEKLIAKMPDAPPLSKLLQTSSEEMWTAPNLTCPSCGNTRFRRFKKEGVEVNLCQGCAGVYFPKGAFSKAFPSATRDEFPFGPVGGAVAGEALFWAAVMAFMGLH